MTIKRDVALEAMIEYVDDNDIVVAVYQTNFDWMALNPRPLNYVAVGAMGQASSHGLGLAIANPNRRVFVLDGDGSLLMNLGSLVTVAQVAPPNFYHFLFANRTYEVNGAHPIPGADKVDFAGMALSAGYRVSNSFESLEHFRKSLPDVLHSPGPTMSSLEIIPGQPHNRDYDYIHSAEARDVFRLALNAPDKVKR